MVKAKTLQVVWHAKEPVYSVDFHPNGQLATGGADKEVKIWEVERGEDGYACVRHVSSLKAHLNTVNCVRFSPTGKHLASSGDGGEVLVWEPADPAAAAARRGNLEEEEGEATWRRSAALKGHGAQSDVMEVSWSPDGTALASAAIDNEVILFAWGGKRRGEQAARFKNHKHFVQGVAWDPAQQFVVTQSADRTARVLALKPPAGGRKNKVSQYLLPAAETARDYYCAHTISKRAMAGDGAGAEGGGKPQTHPLFADERVPTFFRRPAWSPDGSLLVVPTGIYKSAAEGRELNTAYVFARGRWSSPVMHLPGHTKPIVAARFCPVLFERDSGRGGQPAAGDEAPATHPFDLPYKMVLAVATLDSVVLYDTQSALPLAVLGHLHYDSITDLAWSSDARFLAVSSRDCYCSIAAFEAGELGTPLADDKLLPHIAKRVAAAQRRAEPAQPVAAATPATARPAAPAAAEVPSAPQLALSPAAQPSPAATPTAAAGQPAAAAAAAAAVVTAGRAAQAAPVSGRKRIQPEPIPAAAVPHACTAGAAGRAHEGAPSVPEGQPAVKKPKRIVPEAVGPAPAVVGDSQQAAAEASSYREPVAAAPKAPRRIVPQAVEPGSGAANTAAPAPAPPVAAKPPRRIVAEPVGQTAAPASAAKSSLPAESAASGKAGAKRITPTPVRGGEAVSQHFGSAASHQPPLPAPSEVSRDGAPASSRRITPVPVGAAQALPQAQERTTTASAPRGIAALAAAMGAAAAKKRDD